MDRLTLTTLRHQAGALLTALITRLRPKHMPIASKLALLLVFLISSSMIGLGLIIVTNQTQLLRDQMSDYGSTVVSQLSDTSKELVMTEDTLSLMVLISNLGAQKHILGAVIYADDGHILASSGLIPTDGIYRIYSQARESTQDNFHIEWQANTPEGKLIDAVSFVSPIKFQNLIAGHALVTFSQAHMDATIHNTLKLIIITTIIMILLAIFVSRYVGKKISRPIHSLMDASKEISNGNYSFRIVEKRDDEIGYLTDAFNRMANGLLEKKQVENAFSRYVSKNVAKEIMDNLDHIQLGGRYMEGSVIFADIVGFTSLSEKYPAVQVAELLNDYFSYITLASKMYQGTIDKYMGDCAMIVFGVPECDPQHKFHAVYCAVMIQKLIERINQIRVVRNELTVSFRIGINSGPMLAGNLGSTERMQYTVVGETVNLASRLHHIADKGQIIISGDVYNDPDIKWRIKTKASESIQLRGIEGKTTLYLVTDVIDLYQEKIEEQIKEILRIRPAA